MIIYIYIIAIIYIYYKIVKNHIMSDNISEFTKKAAFLGLFFAHTIDDDQKNKSHTVTVRFGNKSKSKKFASLIGIKQKINAQSFLKEIHDEIIDEFENLTNNTDESKTLPLPSLSFIESKEAIDKWKDLKDGSLCFDCEWDSRQKQTTSVIIIITDGQYFTIFDINTKISGELLLILNNNLLYGFATEQDKKKLSCVGFDGLINDLRQVAITKNQHFNVNIGLNKALYFLTGIKITKDKDTTMSFKTFPLTETQISYCEADVSATYEIYKQLYNVL